MRRPRRSPAGRSWWSPWCVVSRRVGDRVGPAPESFEHREGAQVASATVHGAGPRSHSGWAPGVGTVTERRTSVRNPPFSLTSGGGRSIHLSWLEPLDLPRLLEHGDRR